MLESDQKPRILLLIDRWHWAFHTIADAIHKHLSDRFSFTILSSSDKPAIDETDFDIIHVLYEYETHHRTFVGRHAKILRSVYSHYWQEWGLSVEEFYEKHLRDAHAIAVPSMLLSSLLDTLPPPVFLTPEGVDTDIFCPITEHQGPLTVGWAGDPTRTIKRLPWLQKACEGICELKLATGHLSQKEMVAFYQSIDVIACSAIAEGCPRPLLEGMACGCYPVSFPVGIAPEVIIHQKNGLLIEDNSIDGLRTALRWCQDNLATVRTASVGNAELIKRTRTWRKTLPALAEVYYSML